MVSALFIGVSCILEDMGANAAVESWGRYCVDATACVFVACGAAACVLVSTNKVGVVNFEDVLALEDATIKLEALCEVDVSVIVFAGLTTSC